MKRQSKQLTQQEEKIFQTIGNVDLRKKDLLRATLHKITIDEHKLQQHYVLQHSTPSQQSSLLSKHRIYVPALMALALVIFAGSLGLQQVTHTTTTNNSTTITPVAADGSLSSLSASITQELGTETNINSDMLSQNQQTLDAVTLQAESITEVSNENTF